MLSTNHACIKALYGVRTIQIHIQDGRIQRHPTEIANVMRSKRFLILDICLAEINDEELCWQSTEAEIAHNENQESQQRPNEHVEKMKSMKVHVGVSHAISIVIFPPDSFDNEAIYHFIKVMRRKIRKEGGKRTSSPSHVFGHFSSVPCALRCSSHEMLSGYVVLHPIPADAQKSLCTAPHRGGHCPYQPLTQSSSQPGLRLLSLQSKLSSNSMRVL